MGTGSKAVPYFVKKFEKKPVLLSYPSSCKDHVETSYWHIDIGIDTRKWSWLARRAISNFQDEVHEFNLHCCYLCEATADEDLPERILCSFSMLSFDMKCVEWWPNPPPGVKPKRRASSAHTEASTKSGSRRGSS